MKFLPIACAVALMGETSFAIIQKSWDSIFNAEGEGDYAAAVETYEEKLEGNSSRETAAADFLEEWLEEAYDAYLAVSFLTGAWERTWIIWPVTAVAYGAVFAIVKALRRRDG